MWLQGEARGAPFYRQPEAKIGWPARSWPWQSWYVEGPPACVVQQLVGAEATSAFTAHATRRTRLARTAAATWVEKGDVHDKCYQECA